ncbi:MAG: type IV pilus twitching motility protein PilT, partial [Planctomycetota bacterium]
MARTLDSLLDETLKRKASDLHLKVGRPPLYRTHGELIPSEDEPMTHEELQGLFTPVMNDLQQKKYTEQLEVDFAYRLRDEARFRVNLFHQMGTSSAVLRHIPLTIPSLDDLGLPEILKELVMRKQGLILFTGATGSGKSTSMAAMVSYLNQNAQRHVITVEDPVEFVHEDRKCSITQREIGTDTPNLLSALKMALRQDPDVILMGEMRNLEEMEMGMMAAETGHVVFSTLHTNDAKQTIDRIVDTFPADKVKPLRTLLSTTLLAVVSQRLLPRADGEGRIAALEIMVNSPHISELIAEGDINAIEEAIKNSDKFYKMQSFNQAL